MSVNLIQWQVPVSAGEDIAITTILTVALSILLHGLTAAPLSRKYGDHVQRLGRCEEAEPVSEMPLRGRSKIGA